MKRYLIALTAVTALSVLFSIGIRAQATFTTRKVKLSDFPVKTTKVVLTGNEITDQYFRDEVISRWRISPYEFCSLDEFSALKANTDYYFLMIVKGQNRKETEPGTNLITLIKGGLPDKDSGISDMYEVISLPFGPTSMSTGREFIFLPALIDLMQELVNDAIAHGTSTFVALKKQSQKLDKSSSKTILISEDDLSAGALPLKGQDFGSRMKIVTEAEADSTFSNAVPGTLVSYVIAPAEPQKGSVSYDMLFDSQTHELYYFNRHKISSEEARGFSEKDILKFAAAVKN